MISRVLQNDLVTYGIKSNGLIVISGCGTTGRIRCLPAQNVMRHWREKDVQNSNNTNGICQHLCSGGDEALLLSKEYPEDDPITAAQELRDKMEGINGPKL